MYTNNGDILDNLFDMLNIDIKKLLIYLTDVLFTIFVGFLIVKVSKKIINNILLKTKLEVTIINFLTSVINPLIYLVYIISIIDSFGIPLNAITTILATSGVAISLSIKDSLSNLASGVLLVITKPFKVGDYINVLDVEGSVEVISLVMTTLITPDRQIITIPNREMTANRIINNTLSLHRRLDLELCIRCDNDISLVKKVLHEVALSNKYVIKDKEIIISLKEYSNYGYVFLFRPWVLNDNYWTLKFIIVEEINKAFINNNIKVAFNTMGILHVDNLDI